MNDGTIVAIHIAEIKGEDSVAVNSAAAVSGEGLENDRSRNPANLRQVLVMDKETLEEFKLVPGQIKENITTSGLDLSSIKPGNVFFVGDNVTLEATGLCDPCHKMDVIEDGLQEALDGKRGILSIVLNGGTFNVGDSIRVEP
jgi:MOSC domain-containing protein YiiM